ncbi:SPASM domain-containing protein [uncultured Ruminococcus sp.]|uniref:SPASM domain-containing protein n=1 Tax=uncultured Ruminococcus sp. TaxID=165186 RepID=UPI000EBDF37A|nr:SPASM domain-containing protein [uncultured Ruminococcus sp.]HCJ42030.1 radical SAM protein [Ruminococcus sp.]
MLNFEELGFTEKKYYDFPNIINLEVFRGACPCSCVHCPVGKTPQAQRTERFGSNSISIERLEHVIQEISKWEHSTIRIHSVGDPILWDNLVPAIQLIHNYNVRSWIFTSLVTKDAFVLEALCKYNSIIEVSVNSVDAEDYKRTKGIDAFQLVKDNIAYMASYISKNQLKTRLIVSRVQSEDELRDNAFVDYWKQTGLVADAFVRKYHNYNNLLSSKNSEKQKCSSCLVHWMRFNIAYDGTVVTCFNELFHKVLRNDVVLGNIENNSIYEIWHSEKMAKLRAADLSGYKNNEYADDFPCRNCFSCQPYDGKRETSESQINKMDG